MIRGPVAEAATSAAVADAHRHEWAFVLAATVRVTRDIELAEECVQDAYARALSSWGRQGVPARPGAWLTTVARRRAVDRLRRDSAFERTLPMLIADEPDAHVDPDAVEEPETEFPDDRLRLIFTCCHPALPQDAQVALTLRLLCGLTTPEVARAFLVRPTAMAARLTRAKRKIAQAGIPYRVPGHEQLSARIEAVLDVVHLVFSTGHTAPSGADLVRADLVERSLDLARMLRSLLPDDPGVAGLLALILLTDARRPSRLDGDRMRLLAEQDRRKWDRAAIAEGAGLVREALARRPTSRYALMAAIAAVHAEAPSWEETDWGEIVALYDVLTRIWPSPVVALNRAVAVGFARGPSAGLNALDELADEPQLAGYGYFAAARADFLRRLGETEGARAAYRAALELTENEIERRFLRDRLRELDGA